PLSSTAQVVSLQELIPCPHCVPYQAGPTSPWIIQRSWLAAIGSGGSFSSVFATAALPAGSYTISYSYAGDMNFKAVSATSTLLVTYNVTPLYDQSQPHQSGSTIPIKLQLADASGNNAGSSATPVTALYVLDQNGHQVPLMTAGDSNPGNAF